MTQNPKAARFRTYGVIEQPVDVQQPDGSILTTWATLSPAWMGIYPRTGRERFLAGKITAEDMTSIYIWWRPDVTAKMRVSVGGAIYNIVAVLNIDGMNRELELICTQGLNNG